MCVDDAAGVALRRARDGTLAADSPEYYRKTGWVTALIVEGCLIETTLDSSTSLADNDHRPKRGQTVSGGPTEQNGQ